MTRSVTQDPDVVPWRSLAAIGAVGVVVVVASLVVVGLWVRALPADGRGPGAHAPRVAPRELGVVDQTLIERAADGVTLRAAQRAALARYGWVDRDAGISRIPVERAMDLVAGAGSVR